MPFVDGLRALAILAVVTFHAFPQALPGGFAGVDIFFVISGFLITRLIAVDIAAGTFSFARFFVRRARRLLPAALFCFAIVTIGAAFILYPDAYWYYGRSMLSSLFMYANFFFYNTGGYFSAPALEKPLLHTWSLAVEDQFYLTWPLLLAACLPRMSRNTAIAGTVALAVLSLCWAEATVVKDAERAFFMLPTRAWELLVGAALGLAAPSIRMQRFTAEASSLLGLVAIISSFSALSAHSNVPGVAALPACLGTAAVIASGLSGETFVRRLLSLKPAVFLGLISYSLYLWHWPLLALASYVQERPLEVGEAAIVVLLGLAIAVLSWRYVERPFRLPHGRAGAASAPQNDRKFVLGILAGLSILAATAGGLKIWKGLPQRFDAGVRSMLEQLVSGNPVRGHCDNYDKIFANDTICNFGRRKAQGESYEIAVFGDSMADHWTPLVAEFADAKNIAGRQVTNGGCVLFFDVPIPARPSSKAAECAAYQQEAARFIAANPGLKIAVISAYWEKWLRRFELGNADPELKNEEVLPPFTPRETPVFDKVLAGLVKSFTDRGIRVVLIGQIPTYASVPVRCIAGAIKEKRDAASCGKTRAEAALELGPSNEALRRAARNNALVSVSLPFEWMCGETLCPPVMDGVLLYKNGKHVNRFGALHLGRFVNFPSSP